MTDVDTDFVETWTFLIADDVDDMTERRGVTETQAFYDTLAARGVTPVFRDPTFSQQLIEVLADEWGVEPNDDETSVLKESMREHGLEDDQTIGRAASALSRMRRLVLANTTAS
jgi:hypothetical protein